MSSAPTPFHPGLAALLAVLIALLPGCDRGEPGSTVPEEGQGLLLVVVDGLRADRLSCNGYGRATTPRIDGLASEGVLLTRTISASPQIAPSHAALLSGSDANLARRSGAQWGQATVDQPWYLPPSVPRLPVELAVAGFRTAAFGSHPGFAPVNGHTAGFQTFFPRWPTAIGEPLATAEETLGDVRRWFGTLGRDEPWFAYVQLAGLEDAFRYPDPRWSGYFEPRPGRGWVPPSGLTVPSLFAVAPGRTDGTLQSIGDYEARYDGALRGIDAALGELLDQLDQLGRLERTTVCLIGSCGMQFGEAGLILDHGRLSVADLHVPFLLRPALGRPSRRGERLDLLASTMDVAPTLLDLHGLEVPADMLGVSLADLVDPERPVSALRKFAVANCGIQEGGAIFSADHVLEVTLPGRVAEGELIRAWYGDLDVHDDVVEERFYNWIEEPFPALNDLAPANGPEAAAFEAAGFHWTLRVRDLQRRYTPVLFEGLGASDR